MIDRTHTEQAQDLLNKTATLVVANGFGDWSLRGIALQLGTSHRMLIYYFGSSENFWEMVLRKIRHLEQEKRLALLDEPGDRSMSLEESWTRFSSPGYLSIIQLMFEIYSHALRDRERYGDFLRDVVDSWVATTRKELKSATDISPEELEACARLRVAVLRGLLHDLLATGDHQRTTEALRYFVKMQSHLYPSSHDTASK